MKVATITLAAALALSTTAAMAQSGNASNMAASRTTRSAMNSMAAHQRHMARDIDTNRLNGHGINRLGVTTNSGRKYNGA